MKKQLYFAGVLCLLATSCSAALASSSRATQIEVTDMIGRTLNINPGSYKKVVCIGAGALRMFSYVGDVSLLAGVEDIDNLALAERPKMFDGVARPYVLANEDAFKGLPSCGVGGPAAQIMETEKILACEPDIVVSEYEDAQKAEALEQQLGVPVVTLKFGEGGVLKDSFYNSLRLLGKVFDKNDRAETLCSFYQSENQAIFDRTKDIPEESRPGTYLCGLGNWGTTDAYMTVQNYDPMNNAHIKNVVTDLPKDGVAKIDAEKFATLAPKMDVMIFDAAAVKNIRGKEFDFSACKAFQTGEVYLQIAYNAYYTNAETALINSWFCAKAVYPDKFADIDIAAKANEVTQLFNGKALYDAMKAKPQSFGGYQKIANPTEFFA